MTKPLPIPPRRPLRRVSFVRASIRWVSARPMPSFDPPIPSPSNPQFYSHIIRQSI